MKYIIGILVLGLVVLFHEFGHFILARKNHIVVEEFAIGMGPKILSFKSKKSGTVFAWRLLPFGGSCAMLNEDEGEEIPGSFIGAPVWRRALVVAAGPVFNFILAFLLSLVIVGATGADPAVVAEVPSGTPEAEAGLRAGDEIVSYNGEWIVNSRDFYMDLLMKEIPTDKIALVVRRDGKNVRINYQPSSQTKYLLGIHWQEAEAGSGLQLTMVNKGTAARKTGLEMGDIVTALNGTKVRSTEDISNYLEEHPLDGSPVKITYERNGKEGTVTVTPEKTVTATLNFSYQSIRVKQGFFGVIRYSFYEVIFWIKMAWKSLAGMLNGTFGINDMSGPVGIVKTVGDTYSAAAAEVSPAAALLTLLSVMSMISVSLGFMNLIPLPALDGGRLLLMLIEGIRRKPVNRKIEENINFYGLMALLVFIAYITVHDIMKLI
ncbi:site-2 protease family protein [Bilifractor sp. HCP3S3_D3]|uniref:site-2 protease family protein n=1 Tax=Bilifractor sp. HCP3S3_D3 TaxID=3438907 RepID=UPI003F8A05ED